MAGLANPVDRAAEHRDLNCVGVGREPFLDLDHYRIHIELQPPTGRAGNQYRAALAQLQSFENLPRNLHLFFGMEG